MAGIQDGVRGSSAAVNAGRPAASADGQRTEAVAAAPAAAQGAGAAPAWSPAAVDAPPSEVAARARDAFAAKAGVPEAKGRVVSRLEAALRGFSPKLLVTGDSLPIPNIVKELSALTGKRVDPVDARSAASAEDLRRLRREVAQRIETGDGALVVLTASTVSAEVRAVLDEALEGRVNVELGNSVEVPEALPVLALVPARVPDQAMRDLFVTSLPAERALAPIPSGGDDLFSSLEAERGE